MRTGATTAETRPGRWRILVFFETIVSTLVVPGAVAYWIPRYALDLWGNVPATWWPLLLYSLGWLGFVHLNVVVYEEPNLVRRFGEVYDRYRTGVGRWIPGRRYTQDG